MIAISAQNCIEESFTKVLREAMLDVGDLQIHYSWNKCKKFIHGSMMIIEFIMLIHDGLNTGAFGIQTVQQCSKLLIGHANFIDDQLLDLELIVVLCVLEELF